MIRVRGNPRTNLKGGRVSMTNNVIMGWIRDIREVGVVYHDGDIFGRVSIGS